jgi:hypothetical protein
MVDGKMDSLGDFRAGRIRKNAFLTQWISQADVPVA